MTDKEKIIKELKEVLDSLDITNEYRLNLIKAIEYLQEESVSDDLDEEIRQQHRCFREIDMLIFEDIARHFAEWQKQQMMKDVMEYKVMDLHEDKDGESVPSIIVDLPKSFDFDDKVKVIIIKED